MKNELTTSGHSLGEANLHLLFTPAYRRDIFADALVRELTVAYIMEKARALRVHIPAIECGPDHLHLFVTNWKNYAPAELARLLKGYSAYKMLNGHKQLFGNKLWSNKFWSGGYFYRTVGAVNADTVKHYIEVGQGKHWEEESCKQQTTLFNYAG